MFLLSFIRVTPSIIFSLSTSLPFTLWVFMFFHGYSWSQFMLINVCKIQVRVFMVIHGVFHGYHGVCFMVIHGVCCMVIHGVFHGYSWCMFHGYSWCMFHGYSWCMLHGYSWCVSWLFMVYVSWLFMVCVSWLFMVCVSWLFMVYVSCYSWSKHIEK